MNNFCLSAQENDFIEAMNTLENEKRKLKENNNEKCNDSNHINLVRNLNYSPNKIFSLTNKVSSFNEINEIKHKLKKNSSLLEIIDYPFSQNSNKISEIHFQGESSITDKNGETELMLEYTKKYKNKFNNINQNSQNKIKYNKEIKKNNINNNNKIIDNINQNNIKDVNEGSILSYSNETIIINNDYNTSIITEIKNWNNNFYLDNNKKNNKNYKSMLKNRQIMYKKINNNNIFNNSKNNELPKTNESTLKNQFYLSNKIQKRKEYIHQNTLKNDSAINSKLYNKDSKNSIPFNQKSYSNDTEISKDNNFKKKDECLNVLRVNTKETITDKSKNKNNIKQKIKEIPTGKNNKRTSVVSKNKDKKEKRNNSNKNEKNINKLKDHNNKKLINDKKFDNNSIEQIKFIKNKNIKPINLIKELNAKRKTLKPLTNNKNLCLSINKNKEKTKKIIKKGKNEKSNIILDFFNSKNNSNYINKNSSYSKKNLIKKCSNKKLNILTDSRIIFNNIKNKSNSEKLKNLQKKSKFNIYSENSYFLNKYLEHICYTNNQIYDCKNLIKRYFLDINTNKKNKDIKYIERNSANSIYQTEKDNIKNKNLKIFNRCQINKYNNNSNKSAMNIVNKKSLYKLEKFEKSLDNLNAKSYQNNNNNKKIKYIKNNNQNYKINYVKNFTKYHPYKSNKNNIYYINIKTFNIPNKNLPSQNIFNNLFFYADRVLNCKKNSKSKIFSSIPNNYSVNNRVKTEN